MYVMCMVCDDGVAMSQAVDKIKHLTSELGTTKSSLAASQKDNETLRAQV
jgi:hypothetical protein